MGPKRRYGEKLKDPRWQKRRLEVLERCGWECQHCEEKDNTLHVHHRWYEGEPWDAPDEALTVLCEKCHEHESKHRQSAEQAVVDALRRSGVCAGELYGLAHTIDKMNPVEGVAALASLYSHPAAGRAFASWFEREARGHGWS